MSTVPIPTAGSPVLPLAEPKSARVQSVQSLLEQHNPASGQLRCFPLQHHPLRARIFRDPHGRTSDFYFCGFASLGFQGPLSLSPAVKKCSCGCGRAEAEPVPRASFHVEAGPVRHQAGLACVPGAVVNLLCVGSAGACGCGGNMKCKEPGAQSHKSQESELLLGVEG